MAKCGSASTSAWQKTHERMIEQMRRAEMGVDVGRPKDRGGSGLETVWWPACEKGFGNIVASTVLPVGLILALVYILIWY
jgi:hypothetical protein